MRSQEGPTVSFREEKVKAVLVRSEIHLRRTIPFPQGTKDQKQSPREEREIINNLELP